MRLVSPKLEPRPECDSGDPQTFSRKMRVKAARRDSSEDADMSILVEFVGEELN